MSFLLLFLSFVNPVFAATREVHIQVGESWNWMLETPSCDLVVSEQGIVEIKDQGPQVELKGETPGVVKLQCGTFEVRVTVTPRIHISSHLFSSTLAKMKGLTEKPTSLGPEVVGRMMRFRDWKTLAEVSRGRPWQLNAKIDDDVRKKAQDFFESQLKAQGVSQYEISWTPLQITLSHTDATVQAKVRQRIGNFGVPLKFSTSTLELQPLVRVQVHMVELNKSWQQEWGIEWPIGAEVQLLPKIATPTTLITKIKALESKGEARVMASPKLIARSGAEANFLAGGEFAVKIKGSRSYQVQWKQHGVQLKIKPISDGHGRLRLVIDSEISLIDASQSVDGIPGLKTNRLHSEFDLFSGQTLVLSGLIQLQEGQSHEGLAGFSNLPVIGALFRSQNFLEQRSEMVVFVTPEEIKNDGTQKEI